MLITLQNPVSSGWVRIFLENHPVPEEMDSETNITESLASKSHAHGLGSEDFRAGNSRPSRDNHSSQRTKITSTSTSPMAGIIFQLVKWFENGPKGEVIMPQDRTRKIVVTGIMGAISIFLGLTRWGFLPWFGGVSLTIMHIPVIIGAVLEGPIVGLAIGLIFGLFSMLQAAIAPNGPADVWFTNPLLSVLPRLFIGPVAWLVWMALKRWPVVGLIGAGIAGSLTNTILVLGMIGLMGLLPWPALGAIVVANGLPEAVISAILVLAVVAAWRQIRVGRREGANI